MSTYIHLMMGQMSIPLDELGGKCPDMLFLSWEQMSEGAHVHPPLYSNARQELLYQWYLLRHSHYECSYWSNKLISFKFEPQHKKTGLWGFQPGLTKQPVQYRKEARSLIFLI